ncbi:MAG: hypothetical protein A2520_07280 [Deltaproteobacteria bacterium RIFOXYD12_FULL_53_23]|nr:MAG: hypothetical protein A2520_07280 [Deltaproteobacteria bacterium RIFOXYD12_FULL_53_23]
MRSVLRAVVLVLMLLLPAGSVLAALPRVALVIGNATYPSSPLDNPVNDARAMTAKLKKLGFEVIEKHNLTTRQIGPTLREFRSSLQPGTEALFFYAGHGLQVKGVNYLPAVDASISGEEEVPMQSINVNQVLGIMEESKTRLNLIFLDACRNNPFSRGFRSAAGGLAKVEAPSGTLISFATRPGSVAADGSGKNGLYTEQLLLAMEQNEPIEKVLKYAAAGVKKASKGKQEPWSEGMIEGEFYFIFQGPTTVNVFPLAPAPSGPSVPTGAGMNLEDLKKESAKRGDWEKWQTKMKGAHKEVKGFSGSPDLQAMAWERFLTGYGIDNPYSNEDEAMRAEGQAELSRLREAAARQKREVGEKAKVAASRPPASVVDVAKTRFTRTAEGVISDSQTGLEWVEGPDKDTNYAQAEQWVAACTVAGGGWRMPTNAEFKILDQKGVGARNIDPIFNTTGWRVWTEQRNSPALPVYFGVNVSESFLEEDVFPRRVFGVRSRPR